MSKDIGLGNLPISDVIERFESDIVYDIANLSVRYERSGARKELVRREWNSLKPIIDYLKSHPPTEYRNLSTAWGLLLQEIGQHVIPSFSGPPLLNDTVGWILWAEKMISPATHREMLQRQSAKDK